MTIPQASSSPYLAFDIGGTKIASGFVTLPAPGARQQPIIEDVVTIPTFAEQGGSTILRRITELAIQRMKERNIQAIGVGTAGVVDSKRGVITASTDLIPHWTHQPIGPTLHDACEVPVQVVNDVIAHGLGEAHYGAGRGYGRVLTVGVGTGIGGAIVERGKANTGAHGVAGHIGHIMHGLGKGVTCSCGSISGHIEPIASGTGLGTLYNLMKPEEVPPVSSGRAVSELVHNGDPLAIQVLQTSAHALGEAIAGAANLIDPDVIVFSGSVVKAGDLWWDALCRGFGESAMPLTLHTPLVRASLSDDAPLVGAAIAASHALYQ